MNHTEILTIIGGIVVTIAVVAIGGFSVAVIIVVVGDWIDDMFWGKPL